MIDDKIYFKNILTKWFEILAPSNADVKAFGALATNILTKGSEKECTDCLESAIFILSVRHKDRINIPIVNEIKKVKTVFD